MSRILALSGTPIAHTGTVDETILASVSIPGGALGLHGMLRVTHFWSYPNSANAKTPRLRLGGIGGVIFAAPVLTTTVQAHMQHSIANAGAANVQEFFLPTVTSGFTTSATALSAAGAIDTAVDHTLVITAQLASAAETITLRRYLVELIVP